MTERVKKQARKQRAKPKTGKEKHIDASIKRLRTIALFSDLMKNFSPPEDINVSEWAEKYRILAAGMSAEAGPWRTSRTPYLEEPMKAFTDPRIDHIVVVSGSQIGKSEFELNCLGYIIHQDPGSILYVQPTVDEGKKFSRTRIAPMIRNSPVLRERIAADKGRDAHNTVSQKMFPGGILTIVGSNAPSALASAPCRYIIGDEMDRWAASAGKEGDPWELARARQTSFYNRKAIEVSTPTVLGSSRIAAAYETGTQERWYHQCPDCGEFSNLKWADMRFEYDTTVNGTKKSYIGKEIYWMCPKCGTVHDEQEMRRQPQKWIAENPEAIKKGCRSFWLNAFCSPWTSWMVILQKYLDAKDDPSKLEVIWNTLFGELWERRGDVPDNESLLARREHYTAELPEGVLLLTMGVDTQDDRLEYEVVGHGHWGETWGIQKGEILGRPDYEDTDGVWQKLDELIDRVWKFEDGKGLIISRTFIDSGGHYTKEVYYQCMKRFHKRVFPIKGRGGEGYPFTQPPKKQVIEINDRRLGEAWLYTLGVDAGKSKIMQNIRVQSPGMRYCHFPSNEGRGYDAKYFDGLISEHWVMQKGRSGGSTKWVWEKLPGHLRNEPLDIRNYALAAADSQVIDWDRLDRELKSQSPDAEPMIPAQVSQPPVRKRRVIRNNQI